MSGIKLRIGADTSDLERGLSTSQKMLRDNARQMQRNIGVVAKYTAAILGAGKAIAAVMIKQTLQAVDEQSKLARALDTTIDGLTALQLAGDRSGVSVSALNSTLERYTARLGQARRGMGQAADAFDRLGLDAEELAGLGIDQQIEVLGRRFRELNLDASQSADILRDLGIRNADMARFIREGTGDIERARDMVQRYGLALNEVDAQRVEAANDAMQEIGLTARGLRQAIIVELAGPLKEVSEVMSSMFADMGDEMREGVQEGVQAALTAFASLIGGAASVVRFIDENPTMGQFGLIGYVFYGKRGALIGAAISKLFHDVRMELALMGHGVENVSKEFLELVNVEKGIIRLRNQIAEINETGGIHSVIGTVPLEVENFEDQLESLLVRQKELSETIVDQEEQQRNFNDSLGIGSVHVNNIADGLDKVEQTLLDAISNMAEFNNESAQAGQNILGIGTGEEGEDQPTALPVSALSEEEREALQERLNVLAESRQDELESLIEYLARKEEIILQDIANEVEHAEELQDMLTRVQEEGVIARTALADREAKARRAILTESLSNLSTLMQTGSRELFAIGKAAALSEAIINGQAAVTASYRRGSNIGGPVVGAAFAATAAAATGAQISRLASTSFGSGSSGQPTTGGGGTASTAQAQAAPQAGGQTQSLLVQGDFTQDQLFTGTTVRKLIESIAEQQRDGFTVVI